MVSAKSKFSHIISIPTNDIDGIFKKVVSWCNRKGGILDTQEPNYVKLNILHKADYKNSDIWVMEVHTSEEIDGIKVEVYLIERLGYFGKPSKNQDEMPTHLPFMIRSLYKYLGIELSNDLMRTIFTK